MFNLEKSIIEWRRQMLAAGIKTPVPLDELESHLREDAERQMRLGVNEQEAFEAAAKQIGQGSVLKTEFEKENGEKQMKRVLIISTGVIGVLVGMAFVMPAVVLYRHQGTIRGGDVALLVLGAVLTLGGFGTGWLGIKLRKA